LLIFSLEVKPLFFGTFFHSPLTPLETPIIDETSFLVREKSFSCKSNTEADCLVHLLCCSLPTIFHGLHLDSEEDFCGCF
jgi:hypothetical protein